MVVKQNTTLETTLIFGGGCPTFYSEGVIRMNWDHKEITHVIVSTQLCPVVEGIIQNINWIFKNKGCDPTFKVMDSLIDSAKVFFKEV